jgi:hypothetical protein
MYCNLTDPNCEIRNIPKWYVHPTMMMAAKTKAAMATTQHQVRIPRHPRQGEEVVEKDQREDAARVYMSAAHHLVVAIVNILAGPIPGVRSDIEVVVTLGGIVNANLHLGVVATEINEEGNYTMIVGDTETTVVKMITTTTTYDDLLSQKTNDIAMEVGIGESV